MVPPSFRPSEFDFRHPPLSISLLVSPFRPFPCSALAGLSDQILDFFLIQLCPFHFFCIQHHECSLFSRPLCWGFFFVSRFPTQPSCADSLPLSMSKPSEGGDTVTVLKLDVSKDLPDTVGQFGIDTTLAVPFVHLNVPLPSCILPLELVTLSRPHTIPSECGFPVSSFYFSFSSWFSLCFACFILSCSDPVR